jgi:hypothetical protein
VHSVQTLLLRMLHSVYTLLMRIASIVARNVGSGCL